MPDYTEQWERVRRYNERLRRMYAGQRHSGSVDELVDDTYAFFQNCYHLKDWLKNDPTYTHHSDQEIEEFVSATQALAICADICNGHKHLDLTKIRSSNKPKFKGRRSVMDFGDKPPKIGESPKPPLVTVRLPISHGDQMLDALELADQAVLAWEQFL